MSVKMRQRVERIIARRIILDALSAGFTVAVHDGEEQHGPFAKCKDALAAMFSVDEEHLYIIKDGKRVGWVWLVYGNSGWDVVSDYSANEVTEALMEGASRLADKFS